MTQTRYKLHITRPPSVNTLYGTTRSGIKYMTRKGKDWFNENLWEVKRQIPGHKELLHCQLTIHLKTIRTDIDNILKGTLDLLTKSGLIQDDQFVMKLIATKEIVHHKAEEGLDIILEPYEKTKV